MDYEPQKLKLEELLSKMTKEIKIGAISSSHPTTSDIGMMMRELKYEWSNEAQVYYYAIPCKCLPRHRTIQTIDRVMAEHIYKSIFGDNPFENFLSN